MSDAPPPVRAPGTSGDAAAAEPLTPGAIDQILADFRSWLAEAAAPAVPMREPPPVDLHSLVAQFTALRHEVNLQTKATRTSLEQTGEALARLGDAVESLEEQPADDDEVKPLLKALVDVYDNLGIALRQAMRQRETLEKALGELTVVPVRPQPAGFWARLFGTKAASPTPDDRQQRAADAATLIRSSIDSLIAGYKMSLSRVDRALAQFEMETIPVEWQTSAPELMQALEVAGDSGLPAGEVVEELRRGYRWRGTVFRFAQVKVAR